MTTQKEEGYFHQQIGLAFKEDTSFFIYQSVAIFP